MIQEKIGKRIADARKLAGLTQAEAAKAAGVSRFSIGQWEKDYAWPDTKNLARLADVLSTTVEALTGSSPALNAPTTPAQLKSWTTGRLDEVSRGLNSWMEQIIEAEADRRAEEKLARLLVDNGLEDLRKIREKKLREEVIGRLRREVARHMAEHPEMDQGLLDDEPPLQRVSRRSSKPGK